MRIVVHEHSGYAYTAELGRELARRGHDVLYVSCGTFTSPKGSVTAYLPDDSPTLTLRSLRHRRPFEKYRYARRVRQEFEYGRLVVRELAGWRPDVVISANTPLFSQWVMTELLTRRGIPVVAWVQDLYSDAVSTSVGRLPGRATAWVEGRTLRRSRRVALISEAFLPRTDEWHVPRARVHVEPNWAPLPELPTLPRENSWSREHDLDERFVIAYTGLLGLKHDAGVLLAIAQAARERPDWLVLAVADGPGAAELRHQALPNLKVLPFQPVERYPEVLASADVLVSVLTAAASRYSVPSKVQSYLCAGRPVLALVPPGNDAARQVVDAGAGAVVAADDLAATVAVLDRWYSDAAERSALGRAGRAYAERAFDVRPIGERFEAILAAAATR